MHFAQQPFLQLVLIGVIALFPVVNPIGSAVVLSPFFENLTLKERYKAAFKIAFYAFCICVTALFLGHFILKLFGISIPIVQLAGGLLICKMGWELLSSSPNDEKEHKQVVHSELATKSAYKQLSEKLFYPLTFPVTTGAGTISVIFTLSAHATDIGSREYFMNIAATLASVIIMCALVFVFYANSRSIIHSLGKSGEVIINRISAFLIFCVGLQISYSGVSELFKI